MSPESPKNVPNLGQPSKGEVSKDTEILDRVWGAGVQIGEGTGFMKLFSTSQEYVPPCMGTLNPKQEQPGLCAEIPLRRVHR